MRVRCIKVVATFGPNRGETLPSDDRIAVGDEYVVLSIRADASAVWPILIQTLHPERGPLWWPAEMFETLDGAIPSNWVVQLRSDGSLHVAPQGWLEPGFWIEYSERRTREVVERFERELAIITASAQG